MAAEDAEPASLRTHRTSGRIEEAESKKSFTTTCSITAAELDNTRVLQPALATTCLEGGGAERDKGPYHTPPMAGQKPREDATTRAERDAPSSLSSSRGPTQCRAHSTLKPKCGFFSLFSFSFSACRTCSLTHRSPPWSWSFPATVACPTMNVSHLGHALLAHCAWGSTTAYL